MSELPKTFSRLRRFRSALLAGATALAVVGGVAATDALNPPQAVAQQIDPNGARSPAAFDFADIVEAVRPAVVSVQVESTSPQGMVSRGGGMREFFEDLPEDHPMRRFFEEYGMPFGEEGQPDQPGERGQPRPPAPGGPGQTAQGSGFIISEDGYVVTNNHVVSQGGAIRLVLDDGSEYTAEIVGTDSKTDLALLKIDGQGVTFPYVEFSDDRGRVGEWVIAVGNPFGLGGTVTAGIISASGREIGAGPYDDFLQIDAPVNRGNSGGPTFNLEGEVVGVNTAIFSPSGGNVGIAFAIPASVAVPVIEQLRETGEVSRGWLGVQIQPVNEDIAASLGLDEPQGAIVADILDNGPAGDAGIEIGDVVLSIDGEPVEDARDLARRIGGMAPDQEITVQVWRDGQEQTVELTLARQPVETAQADTEPSGEDAEMSGQLGLALAPASEVGEERGVAIVELAPDGEAARKGLQVGDIILEAGGQEVSTPEDVRRAVTEAEEQGRRAVLFRVQSEDAQRFVALSLDRA